MIVVDASVAVKVYITEPGTDAATELLVGPTRLVAPEVIRLEVCGALCRRVRVGELQPPEALTRCTHWNSELSRGVVALTADAELFSEAIPLSIKLKHPLADCLYLALAQRLNQPIVTADRPFHDRVRPFYPKISLLAGCASN